MNTENDTTTDDTERCPECGSDMSGSVGRKASELPASWDMCPECRAVINESGEVVSE